MKVFQNAAEINSFRLNEFGGNKTVGFVPTMGALHSGHIKLVEECKNKCDITIVSIFVNPTQFNDPKDFEKYPNMRDADLKMLKASGVDCVFMPTVAEMYPKGITERVELALDNLVTCMEASHRPGHFDGVITIVKKLFDVVLPHKAFFGEKDFQQLLVVKRLASVYFPSLEINAVETCREPDGLAMSSRNLLLSKAMRTEAAFLYETMNKTKTVFQKQNISSAIEFTNKAFENHPYFELEYAEIRSEYSLEVPGSNPPSERLRLFVAARIEGVRLIDNLPLF